MEVRGRRGEVELAGGRALAVGFSPVGPLGELARYLDWPWPFLSDPDRLLYRRLGVPRAPLRDVYSTGTLARYAAALVRCRRLRRPVEDVRQLGADAVVVGGRTVRVFRPRTPDDRAPVTDLLEALRDQGPGRG